MVVLHRSIRCAAIGAALCSTLVGLWASTSTSADEVKKASKKAGNKQAAARPESKSAAARKPTSISPEQEAAATDLVKEHYEDLFELLVYLKKDAPEQYRRAVRDLSRDGERLTAIQRRDPSRYELELKLWQAQSKRQLLTARLHTKQDEALLPDLREVLSQEQELSLQILQHERKRLQSRIDKLDTQIKKQRSAQQQSVEKRLATLKRAVENAKRNAAKKSRTTTTRKKTSKTNPT